MKSFHLIYKTVFLISCILTNNDMTKNYDSTYRLPDKLAYLKTEDNYKSQNITKSKKRIPQKGTVTAMSRWEETVK